MSHFHAILRLIMLLKMLHFKNAHHKLLSVMLLLVGFLFIYDMYGHDRIRLSLKQLSSAVYKNKKIQPFLGRHVQLSSMKIIDRITDLFAL